MTEVIASVLPFTTYEELKNKIGSLRGVVSTIQIDFCDGIFVPSKTWPFTSGGFDDFDFQKIINEEQGLPFWDEFDFEIDLMVNDSQKDSQEWVRAGASRIVIHIESPDDRKALEALQPLRDTYATAVEVVLAIDLATPIERLESLVPLGSAIQCMGIAHDGFQGQPFDKRAYERVAEIKKLYPEHAISVDGGVNFEDAKKLIDAGATRLIVGSALFEGDARENYNKFESIVNSR